MNPWAVLGVRRDADERTIKRAYAAALKRTRPDDDPVAFQALNEAYRVCLARVQDPASLPLMPRLPLQTPSREAVAADTAVIEAVSAATAEDEPHHAVVDAHAFAQRVYDLATETRPLMLARWLKTQGDIYSINERRALALLVIDVLETRPPLPPQAQDVILNHFDLDDGPWVSSLAARAHALRDRARAAYPGPGTLQFRTTANERNASPEKDNQWLVVAVIAFLIFGLRFCSVLVK